MKNAEPSVGRGAADRVVCEVNVDWRRPGQRQRSPARRMTPRRRLIVCLLVPIACIVAFVVVSISRVESRFIYTRWFDDRRFGIEYSSEVSGDGTANRILNTSFYYPPALIVGIKQFRTPDSRTPTFRMVSNRQNTLHCVFDTLGWGYLAIVDTSTENCPFFCTSGTSHSAPDTLQWRSKFDELLKILSGLRWRMRA